MSSLLARAASASHTVRPELPDLRRCHHKTRQIARSDQKARSVQVTRRSDLPIQLHKRGYISDKAIQKLTMQVVKCNISPVVKRHFSASKQKVEAVKLTAPNFAENNADNLKIAALLLSYGANPNELDRNGETLLDVAVRFNDGPMIELLTKHGGLRSSQLKC